MSCYHPLLGVRDGLTESGKPHYTINAFNDEALDKFPKEDLVQIPCGKCIGCRLDYARQWSDRMLMEAECHENNYFITLTYDDDQIPPVYYDEDGKECVKLGTLRKRDIQLLNKSLRSWLERNGYDSKFKYYVCGEYG